MSYRLDPRRPLPDEVRRVGGELLDDAVVRLQRPGGPTADDVHDIRKDLKKLRSLLRLVRVPLGPAHWRAVDRHLRDTGRALSALRDAEVLVGVVDGLAGRSAGRVDAEVVARVRAGLVSDAASVRAEPGSRPDFTLLADGLGAPGLVPAAWPLDGAGPGLDLVARGLARQYRQGRDALAGLGPEPTGEQLHEVRKRVKDHWYHLRLLRRTWPGPMAVMVGEASDLADHLGDDHDLWVLRELLTGPRGAELAAGTGRGGLLGALDAERAAHLAAIRSNAPRLYAEEPGALVARLSAWWSVASSA